MGDSMSSIIVSGDTSGAITIAAPAVSGTNTLTLPASTGTVALTNTAINRSQLPTGSVLQVVTTTYSTQVSISSQTFTDSGLSLSITPTSATSKILVMVTQAMDVYASGRADLGMGIRLLRDSTTIWNPSVSGTTSPSTGAGYGGGYVNAGGANQIELTLQVPITYLDSPATTSAITYKTQGGLYTTANSSVLTFQPNSAANNGKSQITLMEIAA
jgi:hypothetical protein